MLLQGKRGVIMGIANEKSIGTAIAAASLVQGADLVCSYLPDESGKMEKRVRRTLEPLGITNILPCDIRSDSSIAGFFQELQDKNKKIDFLVHSIAFAPLDDIRCPTVQASRSGFLQAMDASVYSFIASTQAALPLLNEKASILTLSYFGAEKVMLGYNLMGVVKAALESAVRYLAADLGPQGMRVNGISAGLVRTLAASAIGSYQELAALYAERTPMRRNITPEDVGNAACFLLSEMGKGITGEICHVDGGFNVMGAC